MKTNQKQKNIPDGWKKMRLSDLSKKIGSGVTPRGGSSVYQNSGVLFLRSQNIQNGYLDISDPAFISENINRNMQNTELQTNDVLYNITGASIGRSAVYTLDQQANVNQHVCIVRTKKRVSPFFINYWLLSEGGARELYSFQAGGNREGLNFQQLGGFLIDLPSLSEQNRIVAVLETWDSGIEKLKQKIAIKKQIKKGLMQELLTGKKRLPGFSGEWKEVKLEDIAICLDTKRVPLNSEERSSMQGDIPYCGANNIVDYVNDYIFDEDIILVAEDGGQFDEYQNRPIAYRTSGKSWVNNHAHVIKANEENSQDFLFYATVHKNVLMYLNGGTRAKLNKSALLSMKYKIPELDEQKAIAAILITADEEITTLEKKLTLWQEQKRYLLNNLVTGQIRTPENLSEVVSHE